MTDIPIIEAEIEPIEPDMALYLCDRKACENCAYPLCKHTTDISHAVNFEKKSWRWILGKGEKRFT